MRLRFDRLRLIQKQINEGLWLRERLTLPRLGAHDLDVMA